MDQALINSIKGKIEAARLQRPFSNCYSMNVVDHATELWEEGDSFLFAYEDHGVKRLAYFVREMDALDRLLDRIPKGTYFMEIMTKDPAGLTPKGMEKAAGLMRLANPDCRSVFDQSPVLSYLDESIGEAAKPEDAGEINRLLWSVFHTELSHLLSDEELEQAIRAGQVTIHRGPEGIDAVLQAEALPKKFYINQVINRADRSVIHAMLLNRLNVYTEQGGKYLYAWVEDSNIASQKFHAKYGMKHDGMWNMLYKLERTECR